MIKKYSPLKDYKIGLHPDSPMHGDELFVIAYPNKTESASDGAYDPLILNSPLSGEFSIHSIPYGFYLFGYEKENQFTVLTSAGQGGITSIHVVSTSCDSGCSYLTENVPWTDEGIAINDMLNKLYFGIKSN